MVHTRRRFASGGSGGSGGSGRRQRRVHAHVGTGVGHLGSTSLLAQTPSSRYNDRREKGSKTTSHRTALGLGPMANTPLRKNGAGGLVGKALWGLRPLANTPLSTHIFWCDMCTLDHRWFRRVLSTPSTEFQYYPIVMFITTHLFDMCSSMPGHGPMGM